MKKNDVIREGYLKGLREAKRIISAAINEGVYGGNENVVKLVLDKTDSFIGDTLDKLGIRTEEDYNGFIINEDDLDLILSDEAEKKIKALNSNIRTLGKVNTRGNLPWASTVNLLLSQESDKAMKNELGDIVYDCLENANVVDCEPYVLWDNLTKPLFEEYAKVASGKSTNQRLIVAETTRAFNRRMTDDQCNRWTPYNYRQQEELKNCLKQLRVLKGTKNYVKCLEVHNAFEEDIYESLCQSYGFAPRTFSVTYVGFDVQDEPYVDIEGDWLTEGTLSNILLSVNEYVDTLGLKRLRAAAEKAQRV